MSELKQLLRYEFVLLRVSAPEHLHADQSSFYQTKHGGGVFVSVDLDQTCQTVDGVDWVLTIFYERLISTTRWQPTEGLPPLVVLSLQVDYLLC